jgi:hypothetical protein
MTEETPTSGEQRWVPEGAYVVYPIDHVGDLFGYKDRATTRGMMSRHGYPRQVAGWPVEEVEFVLGERDPRMVEIWRDRKRRMEEKDHG